MSVRRLKGPRHPWYADFTATDPSGHRHRIRRSTGTHSREIAKSVEARWRDEVIAGTYFNRKASLTLDQALGRHLLEHGQFLKALDTLNAHYDHYRRHFGKAFEDVTDASVAAYIGKRRGVAKVSTVTREVKVLRSIWRMARNTWKVEVGEVDWPARLRTLPKSRSRQVSLSPAQRQTVMDCLPDHARPVVLLILLTGLRRDNAVLLDWSEVDLGRRVLNVRVKSQNPDGKPLTVPLVNEAFLMLANLRTRTGPVFRRKGKPVKSIRTAWRNAVKRARKIDASIPAGLRIHDLRHDFATEFLARTKRLDWVQKALGHADIKTTMEYLDYSPEDMAEGMNLAFSGNHKATGAIPAKKKGSANDS